jgi:hypothetical protein
MNWVTYEICKEVPPEPGSPFAHDHKMKVIKRSELKEHLKDEWIVLRRRYWLITPIRDAWKRFLMKIR